MAAQYLDRSGLEALIRKIKSSFLTQADFNNLKLDDRLKDLEDAEYDVKYENEKIYLTLDGTPIGSGFDASDFLVDGILSDVDLIVIPGDENATADRPAGRYLKFTFNTDSGKTPIYVNVTDLVDVYTLKAGNASTGQYITVTPTVAKGNTDNDWIVNVSVNEQGLTNTFSNLNTTISAKADKATTYTKTEVDTKLDDLAHGGIPSNDVESLFDDIMG